jgi:hypothetical protein
VVEEGEVVWLEVLTSGLAGFASTGVVVVGAFPCERDDGGEAALLDVDGGVDGVWLQVGLRC